MLWDKLHPYLLRFGKKAADTICRLKKPIGIDVSLSENNNIKFDLADALSSCVKNWHEQTAACESVGERPHAFHCAVRVACLALPEAQD